MSTFREVAQAQRRRLEPLTDDLKLADCGLDSLSFALVVTCLEQSLHYDPFESSQDLDFPVTLGEFIELYQRGDAQP